MLKKRRFRADQSGSVVLIFAIAAPVLLAAIALAVDYGSLVNHRLRLQNLADTAALAAARELSLANSNEQGIAQVARSIVLSSSERSASTSVDTKLLDKNLVEVLLREQRQHHFARVMSVAEIEVKATARIMASRLCLLALESTSKAGVISLNRNARLTARECSVYSNSKDPKGIKAGDSSIIDAEFVCSAGGVDGKKAQFKQPPVTDCPQISDPMADRKPPDSGACQFNKVEIKGGVHTLNPGVYCGGLKITNGASVSLRDGIYIVQGGKLRVDHGASLEGTHVSFFLAGKESNFEFDYDSTISLAAPKNGEMAGILIFDDRGGKFEKHKIFSNNARKLLGTIYLPNGALYIDAKRPIADKSAYTVVVARSVELSDGPELVLNSDYEASDVPVPKGVGPTGSTIKLVN